jgi:N-acetylglucosamine malate deacetylase 1
MQVDILAVGAHPDDIELSASGTLLAHAARGYTFGMLDLTRGELGSRGSIEIRAAEAKAAADILGAVFRIGLDLPDGFIPRHASEENEHVLAIIQVIRQCRPHLILANAPHDRHPDHGRAAQLTVEAAFLSGLAKIETTDPLTGEPQLPWRPKSVYHYLQDIQLMPDFVVDITPHFEHKMQSIKAFGSQFYDPMRSEPNTPISSPEFLSFMEAKNRVFGREAGYTFAEGFIKSRVFGVRDLMVLD